MNNYLLEFEFENISYGIQASKNDCVFGSKVNHLRKYFNSKPKVIKNIATNQPTVVLFSIKEIQINEEITYDYYFGCSRRFVINSVRDLDPFILDEKPKMISFKSNYYEYEVIHRIGDQETGWRKIRLKY